MYADALGEQDGSCRKQAIHEKIVLTLTHNSTALLNMVVFIFFFLAQPYLNIK